MLVTHVQAVGPFLRVFGQLDVEQMQQIQMAIDTTVAIATRVQRSPVPILMELPVDTICLARFLGKQFRRARVIGHRGPNDVFVQFIDYGNECHVRIQEIRLLNFQCPEVEMLQTVSTQALPFILSGIYCQWTPQQMNELNADLGGQFVTAMTDAQVGGFSFISIIWRNENLVNYLVHIKKFGSLIALEEQTNTFCTILTKSRGLVPVRQLHATISPLELNMLPISHPIQTSVPMQAAMAAPIIQTPQAIRMPYKNGISPNRRENPPPTLASPPKRSVVTFKSNTLMVGNLYDVYCCFVENGPCLFTVHLKSTTDELDDMMNQIENIELINLTERPSIGMACIARYSEDNHLYRAVIMTIKPTSCQVAYVDYGNTEIVPFADIFEIPPNFLDQRIFAIRFALSGYKELEPLDDVLKNAFKDMVLHKGLKLKVMPLEGPPLVQYCELYDEKTNILDALKTYKTRKISYLPPPPLSNNDVVVIRYVESPKKFFVQKVDSIRAFDQMMDDLFLHCKKTSTPLQKLAKGSACAVKFDNAWYRAEILGVNQGRVHIRHVDFGNERNVDAAQLCAISERLVKFPVQAAKCCLKGFEKTESLSESATVQLEMLAENENNERRHFKCQIYEILDDGLFLVNLIDDKMRPELNLMKRVYKLCMPFNKYIGLEKEEYPYQQNDPPVKLTDDYISVPQIFNSTSLNSGDQQASTEWDRKSSHSANSSSSRDRSSPSDHFQGNQRQNHHSPNSPPRPFKENNNRREPKESPYTTFKGKGSTLPPRFQKQQDETRRFKENREDRPYAQKTYNSQSASYKSPSPNLESPVSNQPVACSDEWDTEPSKPTTTAAPISTPPREEYVPTNYTYPRSDIMVPTREEIILCWWISPHQFYTHNCSSVPKFEILMRDIQLFYKNKPPSTKRLLDIGSSVVVRYQKDQVLYRATILAHNEALRKYRVEFVDFGNQATVTADDIWLLEKRFAQFPIMSNLCGFENIVSNYEHRQITGQVEKYLKPGLKLFCNYQRKENNMYYADIDVSGQSLREVLVGDGSLSIVEPNLSLNMLSGQQIRIKIVSIKDLLSFKVEIEGCSLKLMASYNDIKFVKSNPHLSTEFKSNYEGKCCYADVISVSKENILMLQPIIPMFINDVTQKICQYPIVYREFNAKISFIETENIIYAQPVAIEEKLAELLDAMYNFYSSQGLPLQETTPGNFCAALSSDGNWYRAKIVLVDTSNGSTEVYYIDYGNYDLIENKDNIRQLDQQFYESSAFAIRFYFPIKSNVDDDSAVETIKTLTEGYELTFSILEQYSFCWIVDIQSNGRSLIDVLKDNYSLGNGKDMEHGRSIIDNDSSKDILLISPEASTKVHPNELELEEPTNLSQMVSSDSGIIVSEKSEEMVETTTNNMVSAYLSHCDNPGRFFLHLTSTYPELQQLQDNIQIVAGSLPPLMTSVTGALCIALYTVDETWYRAKIIDSEIMAVQFIDYGNTDVLTDSSYVKEMNEAFANIPPFAIPCALPISPRNTTDWVDEANSIFNDSYDKTVHFSYVTQNPKKNYVNLKIEGLSVAEKLIADGLARKLEVLKSGENGFVSHINSLADFYIQMESYADGLELIAGHLAEYENFKVLQDNSVGNVCAAVFPEDSSWYRAKILSHSAEGTEVLFIDYGNTAITTELREISTEIANLPFLSKKCSLRMPDYILGWSDEAEAKFHELSAMGETVFVVELIEPSDHAIIDLYIGDRNILEDLEPLCDRRPNIELDLSSSMGKDDFAMHENVSEPQMKEAAISHANSPTDFYIHLLSEKDKLDQVLDSLNNEAVGEALENPEVGMICNALFEDDGACYRAEILSKNDEGYEVIFIDYGNTSISKEVYSLPTGWNTKPALAYQCTLDPNGPLDLAAQVVVDTFLQITGDNEDSTFKVDIIDRSIKPWTVSLHCNDLDIYTELEKAQAKQPAEADNLADKSIATELFEHVIENGVTEAQVQRELVENIVETAVNKNLEPHINRENQNSQSEKEYSDRERAVKGLLESLIDKSLDIFAKNETDREQIVQDLVSNVVEQSLDAFVKSKDNQKQVRELVNNIIDKCLTDFIDRSESSKAECSKETADVLKEFASATIESILAALANNDERPTKEESKWQSSVTNQLQDETSLDVIVTQVFDTTDFYIRICCAEEQLNYLLEELERGFVFGELNTPEIDAICAVFDSTGNTYHRAKILSTSNTGDYNVQLIDSGKHLQAKNLRNLPDHLQSVPALAMHCTLQIEGVVAEENAKVFKEFVESNPDKQYQMKVIDRTKDVCVVQLLSDGVDIQEELAAREIVNKVIDSSIREIMKDAVVSHINAPSDFYIQFSCDMRNLETITDTLYGATDFPKISDAKVGTQYAALFPDDGAFYRAEVLAVLDAGSYEVLFVDFGNVSITSDIRQLPEDLQNIECIAKPCSLENTSDTNIWSQLAIDSFNTLITSHFGETFQVEIKSQAQIPWIVNLFHNFTNIYDELKKLIEEQQSLEGADSSELWKDEKSSSAAIISGQIVDDIIDSIQITRSEESAQSTPKKTDPNDSAPSSDISTSSPLTAEQLAQQLWDGLHKLGITGSNLPQKCCSTSNLCDNNLMKTANSVSALLAEQSDPTRSKSVECVLDNN